ncbi:hypothetical protein BRADI_2g55510v3 [Brachypodium distachyon]|uniref:TNFR-Cys domain-containing protein n=1 Tax=Brachypodium distachyon TaxID=15368 RepID=I1HTK3_BRADI|nr:hypothetical protein BRADI_2g55510v3 [Brachypodium distachyon]
MASGLATLKAVMVIAVFAILVMPSLGHKRKGPLCSDCKPLCDKNCSAIVDANCGGICNTDSRCPDCMARYRQEHCSECCNHGTCSCDSCNYGGACIPECRSFAGVCEQCKTAVGGKCNTDCNNTCNDNCVKKGKGC